MKQAKNKSLVKKPFKSKRKGVYGKKKSNIVNGRVPAKPNIFNGISFRSMLETYFYRALYTIFDDLEYEPETYIVFPGFVFQGKKIQEIKYTPDFRSIKGNFIVETKGRAEKDFPLRFKLFKKYMVDTNSKYILYLLKSQQDINRFKQEIQKQL